MDVAPGTWTQSLLYAERDVDQVLCDWTTGDCKVQSHRCAQLQQYVSCCHTDILSLTQEICIVKIRHRLTSLGSTKRGFGTLVYKVRAYSD
jgi:hypothetical protein